MELSFQIFSGMAGVGFRLDIQRIVDNLAIEGSLRRERSYPQQLGSESKSLVARRVLSPNNPLAVMPIFL